MTNVREQRGSPANGSVPHAQRRTGIARLLQRLRGQLEETEEKCAPKPPVSSGTSAENLTVDDDTKHETPGDVVEGGLERFYAPVEGYEGRHRYDTAIRWTETEEKALVRRIDLRICAWCCAMYFAMQLDRGNIQQALSDDLLDDLGLSTDDYNLGQTLAYACFLLAELPSQLIAKRVGADRWMAVQMVAAAVASSAQALLRGRASFFATRALLGAVEGGFAPEMLLYLSYWYKSGEMPTRVSFVYVALGATHIVAAFLAFGILQLRGVHGMAGWQWLFAIEGAFTAAVGIVSW